MCRSQPISSPVSSKIARPPASTSRSNALPMAGLAVRPEVASDPPQIVPTVSSCSAIGTVGCASSAARCSSTQARPASTVRRVPPAAWITSVRTGRPVASIASLAPERSKLSHPSDTSSTAPTLGWVQSRTIMSCAYRFG